MPPAELKAVLDAVWSWSSPLPLGEGAGERGGRAVGARLLITTRDTTFNDARFGPSRQCAHVELGGLEQADALDLAAAVLDDHGVDRTTVDRQELADLMDRLGGHPLSLYLALPHLRQYTPAQLSTHFEELLPGFVDGKARERNESLAVSLEFSLRRLGEATRAALPDLAVFQGGAMEYDLLSITEIDPVLWKVARAELEQAALITAESLPGISVPFLRFHPTLAPYLSTQLLPERRVALEEQYWREYYGTANTLYGMDTQHPHEARAIALRELPNLRRALDLALATATSHLRSGGDTGEAAAVVVDFATSIGKFLDYFGRWRERDALLEKIANLQSQISSEKGVTKAEYLMLGQQGDVLWQQGQAAKAEQLFRDLLEKMEAGTAYGGDEAAYDHAMTLARLGRCLEAQAQRVQAVEWHRQALAEFERLSTSSQSAKEMLGKVYTCLGDCLTEIGQFDQAQQAYESGLEISKEVGDHRSVGVKLGQLGHLALSRGELAEARRRYADALQTFRAMDEPQTEAVVWHQLGLVAEKAQEWDEAERCYREAVRIREQIRDLRGLAMTCNQLAIVAEVAGRLDDAEKWARRGLKLWRELGALSFVAVAHHKLAVTLALQNRLDAAAENIEEALRLYKGQDLSENVIKAYATAADIAERRGRPHEAQQWRCKEQESYAAYAGSSLDVQKWEQEIAVIVAACQGNAQARETAEQIISHYQDSKDWVKLVAAFRRILGGERDVDILCLGLDRIDTVIVRAILARLAGEAASTPGPREASRGGARGPSEIEEEEDRVARLREQWAPVVGAVVAACQGNADAAAQVAPFLDQLAGQDDWRALVAVLRRILDGERDPQALLPGLDAVDTLIAGDVLRELGVAVPPLPLGEGQGGEGQGAAHGSGVRAGGEGQAISLNQLLTLVAQAGRPDAPPGLAEQLFGLTRTMASAPEASPEVRALGRVLNRVLSGDRAPDLSGLSPELAKAVRAIL
jgi:tetratricopeptide (TPR) repeat protein